MKDKVITSYMLPATRNQIELILAVAPEITKEERKHFRRALGLKDGTTRKTLITTKEACKILNCHSMTLYRYEKQRLINGIRRSQRHLRWDKDDILHLRDYGLKAA